MWVRFPILTCATFIRRSVVQEKQIYFDTQWRDLGDFFWVREMVLRSVRMAVIPSLTSVFTDTGENMNQKPNALREKTAKWQMAPASVRIAQHFFVLQHRLRLGLRGNVRKAPFDFALYTLASPNRRVNHHAEHPTTFWKGRLTPSALIGPGRN
jgi:hypothetical protein